MTDRPGSGDLETNRASLPSSSPPSNHAVQSTVFIAIERAIKKRWIRVEKKFGDFVRTARFLDLFLGLERSGPKKRSRLCVLAGRVGVDFSVRDVGIGRRRERRGGAGCGSAA